MTDHLTDTNVGNIEYIRKQDAVNVFNRAVQDVGILDADDIETVFGMLSSADVAPVVHGEWLPTNDENKKRCNKCDTVALIAMYPNGNANFCPNCGAKMDAQGEE